MRLFLFVISLAFTFPGFTSEIEDSGCTDLSHTTSLAVAQVAWQLVDCNTLEVTYYNENGRRYHQETFEIHDHASTQPPEKAQAWTWNPTRTQLLNQIELHDSEAKQKIQITNIYSLSGNTVLRSQHRQQTSLDRNQNWELKNESSIKTYKRL